MYGELEDGLRKLDTLAKVATWLIYAFIAAFGAITVASIAAYSGNLILAVDQQQSDLVALVILVAILVFFGSAIVIGMWIHRAHANLFAAGVDGLEFTPGWSVGWFFVPIMSLFRPFQAMRELWNRSHGADDSYSASTPQEVGVWWGTYLAGGFFANYGDGLELLPGDSTHLVGAVGNVVFIVSAIYVKKIIDAVGTAQRSMMGIAETFA